MTHCLAAAPAPTSMNVGEIEEPLPRHPLAVLDEPAPIGCELVFR